MELSTLGWFPSYFFLRLQGTVNLIAASYRELAQDYEVRGAHKHVLTFHQNTSPKQFIIDLPQRVKQPPLPTRYFKT